MPQTLKELQSRKRMLERELSLVTNAITQIRDFQNFLKLNKKLTGGTMVPPDEMYQWPPSLVKRFAGGFFRVKYANGASSLYGKTKTGIMWHHTYCRGKYNWVRVSGQ